MEPHVLGMHEEAWALRICIPQSVSFSTSTSGGIATNRPMGFTTRPALEAISTCWGVLEVLPADDAPAHPTNQPGGAATYFVAHHLL